MTYLLAFFFLILSALLTQWMTVNEQDEQSTKLTKLAGLICLIVIQVYVIANGIGPLLGR